MSDGFTIREESRAGRHRVILSGELDLDTAYELERTLGRVCGEGASQVDLDLRGVTFIDSLGLRSVLTARDLCTQYGAEFAVIPNPDLHRVFEVTGLLDVLPWRDPED
jgi:anti-anti-sigma factor